MKTSAFSLLLVLLVLTASPISADDWPQWLGPDRASIWREPGIVERFPEEGLPVKWRVPVGWGYAGPAVADGNVYLMDYVHQSGTVTNSAGTRDQLTGKERVLCLDAATGEELWKHEYDRPYHISYPRGPRCTPTVADGKVYALGAEGDLWCLNADSGKVQWHKSLPKEYQTETPVWGFAAHPLVDGDLVYCVVGGPNSVAVALDKETGKEVWHALTASGAGYCAPTMVEHAGKKQLIIWHTDAVNALDPETGKVFWSTPLQPAFGMAVATPRQSGDKLFVSGIRDAAALFNLETGEVIWRATPKTAIICSMSPPLIVDEVIYGNDGPTGTAVAARLDDAERLWQNAEPVAGKTTRGRSFDNGTFFLVKNEDRYFLLNDSGELILAHLTPEGYNEISRASILEPTNNAGPRPVVWSHPAFAEQCVFARNDKELVCVSLAAAATQDASASAPSE